MKINETIRTVSVTFSKSDTEWLRAAVAIIADAGTSDTYAREAYEQLSELLDSVDQ